jgi:hypothetical protein
MCPVTSGWGHGHPGSLSVGGRADKTSARLVAAISSLSIESAIREMAACSLAMSVGPMLIVSPVPPSTSG